jgi:hypothetical protein
LTQLTFKTNGRPALNRAEVTRILKELEQYFENLPKKKLLAVTSPHEAYGYVAEEVKELLDAVHKNNISSVRSELMDVAISAIWAVASMQEE